MAKKIVKVSTKQLQMMISEEANRYRKVLELKKKKESIMSQLNEMYEECDLKEIMGGTEVDEGLKDVFQKAGQAIKTVATGNPDEATAKQSYLNTIAQWKRQGYISPNQQEFDVIMQQAKADGFAGKLGSDANKKIIYRPAKDIKWGHDMAAPTGKL